MSDHPDVAELLDRWEDVALTHSTWIALSRMLDFASRTERGINVDFDVNDLTEMVRAGVCFVAQSLPDMDYRSRRSNALFACHTVAAAINMVTVNGAGYSLDEARTLARREAYGL